MALRNDSHVQPEKNRDPAEAGRAPEQLTAEGKRGAEYDLYEDTKDVQIGGDRNDRVTEFHVNDHNTEPSNAPAPNAYENGLAEEGQGISNHPLREELIEQEKLTRDAGQKKRAPALSAKRLSPAHPEDSRSNGPTTIGKPDR